VKTGKDHQYKVKRYTSILMVVWTLAIAASLIWNHQTLEKHFLMEAQGRAKTLYYNDIEYRRWNASHGGVYVPVTEKTPPNPYLSHIPDRDVTTTAGKKLTLMNPAYMTRQVHELMKEVGDGPRGHITSLNPIRPENRADPWETEALKVFEDGELELASVEQMPDGKSYLRYMHALVVEMRCLKCHAAQGYEVGDIRGGVSVSVPIEAGMASQHEEQIAVTVGHGFLWLLGLGILVFGGRKQMSAINIIQDSEERFALAMKGANDGMWDWNLLTNEVDFSKRWKSMLGYSEDELENVFATWERLVHPEDIERAKQSVEDYLGGKTSKYEVEFRMLHKDGHWVDILARGFAVRREPDQKYVRLVGTHVDITERKQAEEALRQRLDELERFQKATVKREFRIQELKAEVEELKKGAASSKD
jgi:PAS domain S-box-containing protein